MCVKIHKTCEQLQPEHPSVVICGDMNSMPGSLVHDYLTLGRVPRDHAKLGENRSKLSELLENPLKLKLARGNPNYTNYKPDFKEVIDYVLCDSNSTVSFVDFV